MDRVIYYDESIYYGLILNGKYMKSLSPKDSSEESGFTQFISHIGSYMCMWRRDIPRLTDYSANYLFPLYRGEVRNPGIEKEKRYNPSSRQYLRILYVRIAQ